MRFLRSNTAVIVTVGPFYDKSDGITIETALTITNERITLTADTDAGSAPTNILDNVTGATSGTSNDLNYITGNDAGMMQLELAAADVNRVGRMFLSITDAANHVPVFHLFFVLPQAIYDWLTGVIVPLPANMTQLLGTAVFTPSTAGILDVNIKNIVNAAVSTSTAQLGVNAVQAGATAWGSGAITAASIATDAITAAKIADGAIDAATFAAGAINAAAIAADAIGASELAADAVTEIRSLANGTSDSGTTTTMVDAARTEADTDYWVGSIIVFTSGNIAGQARYITAFTTGTDTITFAPATTQAVATQTYEIWPTADFLRPTTSGRTLDVSAAGEAGIDWANIGSPTTAQNLSATNIDVDQVVASVSGAVGSVTGLTAATVHSDLDDIQARLPAALTADGNIKADTLRVGGTLQTAGDIIGDTNDIQTRLPAALVSGRIDSSVGAMASGVVTATAIAADAIGASELAADAVTEIRSLVSGTSDSGTTLTMVDAARTEADTDYWVGNLIVFTSGNIAGQARYITAFTPASDTITFAPATTQAVTTQTYEIWPTADFLRPTATGRTLDVSAGGEAGLDWANIGSPTTAQNLSATNIDVDQIVASVSGAVGSVTGAVGSVTGLTAATVHADLDDIQARLPAALVGGRIDANVGAISSDATAADNAEAFFDGTGYAGTGNVIPSVTTVTGNVNGSVGSVTGAVGSVTGLTAATVHSDLDDIQARLPAVLVSGRMDSSVGAMAAAVVTAAAIATDAIDADALAADAVAEINSAVSGTSDSGTTTTMVDAARTEADTDYWKGNIILFTSGTVAGQARLITAFTPGTDTITFAPATTAAVGTQTYQILPAGRADIHLVAGVAINALISGRVDTSVGAIEANVITATAIAADAIGASELAADAVTEIQAGLATSAALSTVQADTDDIQTRLPAALVGGRIDANVGAISSDVTAADNAEAFFDGTGYAGTGNVIPSVTTVTGNVNGSVGSVTGAVGSVTGLTAATVHADLDDIQARLPAALVSGRIDASVGAMAADVITAAAIAANAIGASELATDAVTEIRSIVTGTADSGSTTTVVDTERTEADTDYWKDMAILFTSGSISGQARLITAFNAATDTITFSPATTQAVGTNTYSILSNVAAAGASAPTAAEVADAVWDEDATAHQTQGTFGQAIGDPVADVGTIFKATVTDATGVTVGTDTATILTRLGTPSDLGGGATVAFNLSDIEAQTDDIGAAGAGLTALATQASVNTIDDFLDTEVAAILAAVDTEIATIITRIGTPSDLGGGATVAFNLSDIEAQTDDIAALATAVDTIDNFLDTEIAAILAAVDTEVTAIKAKTDTLPEGIAKNVALANFEFYMVMSTDHITPATGLTVTCERSIDGGAFAAMTNSATEVSAGLYKINLAAADTNGDFITLKFTAAAADATIVSFKTE